MSCIAVLGAGPLGGALADALARRDRIREVRLIDPAISAARGKALDIQQSAPIERFAARLSAADTPEAAAGAAVIVIADSVETGEEHAGDGGLPLLRRVLTAAGPTPILFAGARQRDLVGRAVGELRASRARVLGSAPMALESALRALTALALDAAAPEIALRVLGVPPDHAVVAWEEATASGLPLSSAVPPHVLAGLSARLPKLWPPGPYALAAAAARVAGALAHGSRRRFTCFVCLDSGPSRASVAAMPVELREGRIERVVEPALTRQERTLLENALEQ